MQVRLSLQQVHNSNPLASSSTRATSTPRPTRIPPKTERTPARFSFFPSFFLCQFPRILFGFSLSMTHYSRTISALYTHNKRTIPNTSSEDEDTIPAITPYTLRPTPYTIHYTPYTITFIKIAVSFPSLILCLIPPTDDRETTEGTPKEDQMTKKALFLRLSPKKVDLIPEKVVSLPKTIDSIPETVDLHFSPLHPKPEKSRQNTIFLAHLEKKV